MFLINALRSEEFNRYVDNSSHTVINDLFLSKILAHRTLKRGGSLQGSGDPSGPSGAGTLSSS